jgi:hypothetical protein
MSRKKLFLLGIIVLVLVGGGLFWRHRMHRPRTITLTLPDGRQIVAYRASRMNSKEKLQRLAATVQGTVAVEKSSNSPTNATTIVVVKGLDGVTYGVANAPFVNGLRFNYMGKKVELKGYWADRITIGNKDYKTIWIEGMKIVEKVDVKQHASRKKAK